MLGGSETYTRKTAEALALREGFEVEVLTSKAVDFKTWANYYEKDVEVINGVTVRRFKTAKNRDSEEFLQKQFVLLVRDFCIHVCFHVSKTPILQELYSSLQTYVAFLYCLV